MLEIVIDPKKCTGCGLCLVVCPKGPRIFEMEGEKARVLDPSFCTLCTLCLARCPVDAIAIKREG
jgi:NAD-dependent dihydropyrimidine dehydrogenase PreA subunit